MNRPHIKPEVIQQVKLNGTFKKKRVNRPHINSDIIQQVKLRKIEEEKEVLKRQREFVFEQQRQAFLQQQSTKNMQKVLYDEPEEEQGMTM